MNTKIELSEQIIALEIICSRMSREIFPGSHKSAFKGKGMSFDKVREYQIGDDTRHIDWHVTARFNSTHIKVFEEERDLDFYLLLDLSRSMDFGGKKTKKEILIELAAIFIFTAIRNNDKIGAIIYTDRIEKFIPAGKGKKHGLRILTDLIQFKTQSKTTDFSQALKRLNSYLKKPAYVFSISDFLDTNINEHDVIIFSKKHDFIAIKIEDKREKKLPQFGFLHLYHAETQQKYWFNSLNIRNRHLFATDYHENSNKTVQTLMRCGVNSISINTEQGYIEPLKKHFSKKK